MNPLPTPRLARVPLADIICDSEVQPRAKLNQSYIASLLEDLRRGLTDFPPGDAFVDEGGTIWLSKGFHRKQALDLADRTDMPCYLHQGSKRDAIRFNAGDNAEHGLRRNSADTRADISRFLLDDEWRRMPDRAIARLCRVSPTTVGKLRKELGVQVDERTVQRAGQTYQLNVVAFRRPEKVEPKPCDRKVVLELMSTIGRVREGRNGFFSVDNADWGSPFPLIFENDSQGWGWWLENASFIQEVRRDIARQRREQEQEASAAALEAEVTQEVLPEHPVNQVLKIDSKWEQPHRYPHRPKLVVGQLCEVLGTDKDWVTAKQINSDRWLMICTNGFLEVPKRRIYGRAKTEDANPLLVSAIALVLLQRVHDLVGTEEFQSLIDKVESNNV